jgi:RNA polymerase sigma-32 factor
MTEQRNLTGRDDLSLFLGEVRRLPMLSADEEYGLARRYLESGDAAAAERLVGSHLRLVIKIARGYLGYGLPIADLIAVGNVGLVLAVQRFDPDRGARFATYASWWIRAEIQDYVLRNQSLVRMGTTSAEKKLFFNLRRLKHKLGRDGEGLTPAMVAEIARVLDVAEGDVMEMDRRLGGGDSSLNAGIGDADETEWQDLLVDESADPESAVAESDELSKRRAFLARGLASLNPRERDILAARRLSDEPQTLEQLSGRFGISRERVRQIEARALSKLQRLVKQEALPVAA